jgi:hypothetical protein
MLLALEIATLLGLAATAGLHFPVFLILPWILLVLGVEAAGPEMLGGLSTPLAAGLGGLLLTGSLLARPLPWGARGWRGLVGVAGVLAAAQIPFLPGMPSPIPSGFLAVAAVGVAALTRTARWGSQGLATIRETSSADPHRAPFMIGDAASAMGLVLASLLAPPVVLVLLPILFVVLMWRGRDSLRFARFQIPLFRGWLRSLQHAPQWDTLESLQIAGEDALRTGPFVAVPAFFAGGRGEPASAGRLVLSQPVTEATTPLFLERRRRLSRHQPQAVPLPFSETGWNSRTSRSDGLGIRITLDDPESPGILIIPAGYPPLPSPCSENKAGL